MFVYTRFMKQYLAILGITLLCVMSRNAHAQSDTIVIHGQVIDLMQHNTVAGVNVINSTQGSTIVTDAAGRFNITCQRSDVLFLFLTGYLTRRVNMLDSPARAVYDVIYMMDRLTYTLNPVIVKPKPTLDKIEEERKKLGYIPRELRTPEIYYTSPISAIYELLSSHARERNKLREQIQEDDRRRIFRELFDFYKHAGLFDLPENQYEPFIDYLAMPVDFLKYQTDYEITKTVLDAYRRFGLEKGFIK
jgi:hypothetical protein